MRSSTYRRSIKPTPLAGGRDKRLTKGIATRELILLAAEKVFAEFGIAAISLRDIAVAAGQKNNATVQYHFGDKENLLREIVRYRVKSEEEVMADFVVRLLSDRKRPQVVDYVRNYVSSFASNIEEGNYYIPFVFRFIIERGGLTGFRDAAPSGSLEILRKGLRELLPDCSEATIDARWQIVVNSVIHALANYQAAHRVGALSESLNDLLDDLIRFHTAGLGASPRASAGRGKADPRSRGGRRREIA